MPIANACSIGYPHDGRADNAAYWHDRRADNAANRYDRRADSLSRYFVRLNVTSGLVSLEFFPFDFSALFRHRVKRIFVFDKKVFKM